MDQQDPSRFLDPKLSTSTEIDFRRQLEGYIANGMGTFVEKFQNFSKYIPVQDMRRFLCKYELFKKILPVHGSIVECGVAFGGGLMTWSQLSEMFEPVNRTRRIIGFDSFCGFPSISTKDKTAKSTKCKQGGYKVDCYEDIQECLRIFNNNRVLKHIEKTFLVKGDACKTIPQYVKENPYLVISLLYLDFDIYEPTLCALKNLVPRIPKGGIIAFDELNDSCWPGETIAVLEEIGLKNLRLERFPYAGTMSYAIVE